eukprot:gene4252-biopygen4579
MWYHRVSQTRVTVAVNFWYDMRFDFRYVFSQLAFRLAHPERTESNPWDSDEEPPLDSQGSGVIPIKP